MPVWGFNNQATAERLKTIAGGVDPLNGSEVDGPGQAKNRLGLPEPLQGLITAYLFKSDSSGIPALDGTGSDPVAGKGKADLWRLQPDGTLKVVGSEGAGNLQPFDVYNCNRFRVPPDTFFTAVREAVTGRPLVTSIMDWILLGKTTAAHAKGAAQDVAIYSGDTLGSETDTTETVSAYNRFADLATDKWVLLVNFDAGYQLIAGEC